MCRIDVRSLAHRLCFVDAVVPRGEGIAGRWHATETVPGPRIESSVVCCQQATSGSSGRLSIYSRSLRTGSPLPMSGHRFNVVGSESDVACCRAVNSE